MPLYDRTLKRGETLRLLQITGPTLDKRVHDGHLVYGLGCQTLAHVGDYLIIDNFSVLFCSMLSGNFKIEQKVCADLVGEYWEDLTFRGLTEAERNPDAAVPDQTFFAVGKTFDGRRIARVGSITSARAELDKSGELFESIDFMSIQRVLRQLRENARLYKVSLPTGRPMMTVAPGEPGYDQWLTEIETHRRVAGAKYKAKMKARKAKAMA